MIEGFIKLVCCVNPQARHQQQHGAHDPFQDATASMTLRSPRDGEHGDERRASHLAPGMSKQTSKRPNRPSYKASDDEVIVEETSRLAAVLEGDIRKYPKSGNLYGAAQNRYIAVIPFQDVQKNPSMKGDKQEERDWHRDLRMWRRGRLAYWTTKEAFSNDEDAKGALDLMKIAKVDWTSQRPLDVCVRHKQGNQTHELLIQFVSEERAYEWKTALHSMRALLQHTVKNT